MDLEVKKGEKDEKLDKLTERHGTRREELSYCIYNTGRVERNWATALITRGALFIEEA